MEYKAEMSSQAIGGIEFNEDNNVVFNNITTRIEKKLADLETVVEDLNKMREKTAAIEWKLMNKVNSATWKDISELIGLSNANIIDECFKILDRANENEST